MQPFGWLPERDGHLQRMDREVRLHTVTHSPADDASGMQIQDDGQIQPTLARSDIADVHCLAEYCAAMSREGPAHFWFGYETPAERFNACVASIR